MTLAFATLVWWRNATWVVVLVGAATGCVQRAPTMVTNSATATAPPPSAQKAVPIATATTAPAVTVLPRQCGPVDAEQPERIVCPRGWNVCMVANPDGSSTLRQPGFVSPLPTVVWRDVNQDGVRDGEARYSYNSFGQVLTAWVDNDGNGLPEFEARNTYDTRGLLTDAWSDSYYDEQPPLQRRYTYSGAGWLTSAQEKSGEGAPHVNATYQYDAQGRMQPVKTGAGAANSEMHTTRNAAGNVTR